MSGEKGLPPLNWLRAFDAAARHLSFTGAAGELNMTQSAVSQQIKSLEGHLGRALFHRRPRGLELTETGSSYLPIVRDAFRTLSRGTRAITGGGPKIVQVHSNLSFATFWLGPRLGSFQSRHPDVRLNIIAEQWEPPHGMIAGADVEIRYSVRPSSDLSAEKLVQDWFYPVATSDWHGNLEDVPKQRLYDVSNLLSTWNVWAEEVGLETKDLNVTYATTYTVGMMAALAGSGLCMAHDTIAGHLIRNGRLKPLFDHRARMQEAYYLITSPTIDEVPGARVFANWIKEEMAVPPF